MLPIVALLELSEYCLPRGPERGTEFRYERLQGKTVQKITLLGTHVMSASSSLHNDTATEGVELELLSLGAKSHFCASCFVDKGLQRCGRCRLVYYCGAECQRENWTVHSVLCNNDALKRSWVRSFMSNLQKFESPTELPSTERKAMISALKLLEPWAKGIVASHGLLQFMVDLVLKEQYSNYNFSLVALVDVLREPNAPAVDFNMCLLLLCTTNGLNVMLEVIARHARLNGAQRLSTLRFLRLLTAHSKLQAIIREQLPWMLPIIAEAVQNAGTIDVASEFGIVLCSLLYSADTPDEHHQMQKNYVSTLNFNLWMGCAFGDSHWAADFDMGAVELLLALLIDVDLFPDYPENLRHNVIDSVLLKHSRLLEHVVYGFLDMINIPKDVFQGAALHALSILFSHPAVLKEIMLNFWLMTDVDDDEEDEQPASPLRAMLKLFQAEPIVQLNFFKTHMHSSILRILIAFLSSAYCNKNCVEAAVGAKDLFSQLEYLEKRYRSGLRQAEKWKQNHGLLSRGRAGNESEMESVLELIAEANRLLAACPEDIMIPTEVEEAE